MAKCLATISEEFEDLPRNLPPGMAQRYAVTQKLAEAIKQAGFRGDVGYQTLLYANIVEVRRVLMFLVEKLPKEADKTGPIIDENDPIRKKEVELAQAIAMQQKSPWIPPYARKSSHSLIGLPAPFRPKTLRLGIVAMKGKRLNFLPHKRIKILKSVSFFKNLYLQFHKNNFSENWNLNFSDPLTFL